MYCEVYPPNVNHLVNIHFFVLNSVGYHLRLRVFTNLQTLLPNNLYHFLGVHTNFLYYLGKE